MGVLIKLKIEDETKELSLVVEQYDGPKKNRRTLVDVIVPLVSKGDHISDIDDCTNEDLILDLPENDQWNGASNDLERVLGEELDAEINRITGTAASNNHEEIVENYSTIETSTAHQRKADDDSIEAELMDDQFEFAEAQINNDGRCSAEICLSEDDGMIVQTDRSFPTDAGETFSNVAPAIITNFSAVLESGNDDANRPTCSITNSNAMNSSNRQEDDSTVEIPRRDIDRSPQEEIMDLSDEREENIVCETNAKIVDLTEERDNAVNDAASIISDEDAISLYHDPNIDGQNDGFDDEDEVGSQYSSARDRPRHRSQSSEMSSDVVDTDVHSGRALSHPPEVLVEIDDEVELRRPLLVDLTGAAEKKENVECIDLTNEKKSTPSTTVTSTSPVIRRSMNDVMNDIRDFYKANKDVIAQNQKALLAFGATTKKSRIEAPSKQCNYLSYPRCGERKRSGFIHNVDDLKSKVFKTEQPRTNSRVSDENVNSHPIMKAFIEAPVPICGPSGYRSNDRFHDVRPNYLADHVSEDPEDGQGPPISDDHENRLTTPISFAPRTSHTSLRRKSFGNFSRRPRTRNTYQRWAQMNRHSWKKYASARFNQISPLRRQLRTLQPSQDRGNCFF